VKHQARQQLNYHNNNCGQGQNDHNCQYASPHNLLLPKKKFVARAMRLFTCEQRGFAVIKTKTI